MTNSISLPLLDRVDIATPCHARWEDMTGDERVRHCAECNMRVHNISAMARDEAEALLRASVGERLCVRLYRRADGTILTQDCPVGVMRVRRAMRRTLVRVAALVGLASAAGVAAARLSDDDWGSRLRLRALRPFSTVCAWIAPGAPPAMPPTGPAVAGRMCIPVTPASAPALGGPASTTN
jgi:hypothetical protein